ncbi:segregation and condensation protein A [Lichenicoccus roseus]|uniref:Segregation/condensation protein A n=1 Tax=Lichenicoccus roseus TaxID=2683649 RepID=A0A5R9J097_9PROT|nr:hypothetical protein [Lichenicoccus roseus]TLU71100.1 hypothetical protein FE263_18160 [Lichenicoccus roseus]
MVGGDQPDEVEWEQKPRAFRREGDAPVLSVDGFEGLLDWLLELVRTHRLDLSRLSIVALIEAFADALEQALQQDGTRPAASSLSRWADWLVMAATLTQLRARLILPTSAPEAQAALREADALRRQLLSQRHIQAAVDWLERRQQLGVHVWARGRSEQGIAAVPGEGEDLAELMRACLVALALPGPTGRGLSAAAAHAVAGASVDRPHPRAAGGAAGWQRVDVLSAGPGDGDGRQLSGPVRPDEYVCCQPGTCP